MGCRRCSSRGTGQGRLRFNLAGDDFDAALDAAGSMPLPPYIAARRAADAPTGRITRPSGPGRRGLSRPPPRRCISTMALLRELGDGRRLSRFVTLHVGAGTFLPVKVEDVTIRTGCMPNGAR